GVFVGQQDEGAAPDGGVDGRWALSPTSGAELFNDDTGEVAPLYVNSIQLRDTALTTGQVIALGKPSATGIPSTIPPIPPHISDSSPFAGATDAPPQPDIQVTFNSGDSTVAANSVKLLFDNVPVAATVTPNGKEFDLEYQVPNVLDPESTHKV